MVNTILPRRARTLPRQSDLPFSVHAERGAVVWSSIAGMMFVSCLLLLAVGIAVTR